MSRRVRMRWSDDKPPKQPLECVDAQNEANRQSLYARQEIEVLRYHLAEIETDARQEQRLHVGECARCFYLRSGGLAGCAFTDRDCDECGEKQTFSSTDTRKVCMVCSTKLSLCRNCGGDIDMQERHEIVQPRTIADRTLWWNIQETLRKTRNERRYRKKDAP